MSQQQQQQQQPYNPPPQPQPQQYGGQAYYSNQQPAPGSVMYYPQQPGGPQVVVGPQAVPYYGAPPKYEYVPSDFIVVTLLTMIICGIFSPFSLAFSIPALLFSLKSSASAKLGAIKVARRQGMVAAYLNVAAVIFALVVAFIVSCLVLGLYGKTYALQKCIRNYEARNGPLNGQSGYCNY